MAPHELDAVTVERPLGVSPFVFTCDHAGVEIPAALTDLGLPETERRRHIGWDIGALGVAQNLSAHFDAPLVWQRYSRLVIDCNRPPTSPALIPVLSEATSIPGNEQLSVQARQARIEDVYSPYHEAIDTLLDQRMAADRPSVFVSVHSFTPAYLGQSRPWHVGVLYGSDQRLAKPLLSHFAADDAYCVGDNEPYRIDGKDHTLPEHAFKRDLLNVLFEVRQDLLATPAGESEWSERLAEALLAALAVSTPTFG